LSPPQLRRGVARSQLLVFSRISKFFFTERPQNGCRTLHLLSCPSSHEKAIYSGGNYVNRKGDNRPEVEVKRTTDRAGRPIIRNLKTGVQRDDPATSTLDRSMCRCRGRCCFSELRP